MKYKWLAAVAVTSTLMLTACGTDQEEAAEEKVVEEEQQAIDLSKEANVFKAYALEQMDLFVEDAKLLKQHIDEEKLEEAQKLYPLVRMYVERLQPLKTSFAAEFAMLDGKVKKGKEEDIAGLAKVEKALFADKSASAAAKEIEEVVKMAEQLASQLEAATLDGTAMLEDTDEMLANLATQLNGGEVSYAFIDVYETKANVEAVEQMVAAFMSRAETATAAKLTEETVALNKVIEFYEIGKEDYIKYDIFTKTQKEQLLTAVNNVAAAYKEMKETIK